MKVWYNSEDTMAEKQLPHPRTAGGMQITQSWLVEVVTINNNALMTLYSYKLWVSS